MHLLDFCLEIREIEVEMEPLSLELVSVPQLSHRQN